MQVGASDLLIGFTVMTHFWWGIVELRLSRKRPYPDITVYFQGTKLNNQEALCLIIADAKTIINQATSAFLQANLLWEDITGISKSLPLKLLSKKLIQSDC